MGSLRLTKTPNTRLESMTTVANQLMGIETNNMKEHAWDAQSVTEAVLEIPDIRRKRKEYPDLSFMQNTTETKKSRLSEMQMADSV